MATPRVVLDALVPDVHALPGGLRLRPLSIAHSLLLQKIDSPFIRDPGDGPAKAPRKGRGAPVPAAPRELDALAVVYILTRDDSEIDQLFYGFDRARFDRDVWSFAKSTPPAALTDLDARLIEIFRRGTSTLIGAGDDAPSQGEKKTS